MNPIKENFGVRGAKMRKYGTLYMALALLLLMAAVLPGVARAGTAGKAYNISIDTGTLDNAPIFSITSFPATFKIRARVIDQTGAPLTGLTSSELVVQSVKNASTGAVLAAGSNYVLGAFSEVSAGVYDRIVTLNSGALGSGHLGQFEVRVTGPTVDNQWLAATVFVKNGAWNYDVHTVDVQSQNQNGVIPGIHDYTRITLTTRLADPWAGNPLSWNTGTWSIKEIRDSDGILVSTGLPYGVYFQHDYYSNDMVLSNIQYTMTAGKRYYINLVSNLGYKEFMVSVGLTAVASDSTPTIIPVPSFASPIFFPATYVVNNGDTSPQNTSIGPGAASAKLNSFMLSTFVGTDTLTAVTVTLTPGSVASIGLIEIARLTNQGRYGGVIGSLANPDSDVVTVPVYGSTILDVNNINTVMNNIVYSVWITPKSHAAMPAPPGATYVMTGKVTGISHTEVNNNLIYSSTDTSTITIDNQSPANPVWSAITPSDGQLSLSWVNPPDPDFSQVVILRNTVPVVDVPAEGGTYTVGSVIGNGASTVACVVNKPGTNCTDTGLANGVGFYYRIFAKDTSGNYSAGGTLTGPLVTGNQTTTGSCTATASGLTTLTVAMPYSNDINANNGYTVDYKLSAAPGWTNWVTAASHTASPYVTTITGLSQGGSYDVRCTYLDPDGIDRQNPQTVANIVLPDNRTTTGTASATAATTTSIAVAMPYATDSNGNNSYTVDYQLAGATGWTNWITAAPHVASPYTTTITGLEQGGAYIVRMTYLDDDGVLGINPQTISYVTLPDNRTDAYAATVVANSATSITVNAPFASDANGNGTVTVEYRRSIDVSWSMWVSGAPHPASPYATTLTSLVAQTAYDIRVTYQDPDGVMGMAEQTLYNVQTLPSKLMHNSLNANKKGYWAQYGGWGIPGGQYGEFTCLTCHTKRATNASGIRPYIMLFPLPGSSNFGGQVRFDGPTGPFSFGDDSVARPFPQPVNRICEVCHTLTTSTNSGPIHRNILTVTPNHAASNGKDCTRCHKHDNGFAGGPPR